MPELEVIIFNQKLKISYQEDEKIKDMSFKKVGRNEKCPCGSGKKFKYCHGNV